MSSRYLRRLILMERILRGLFEYCAVDTKDVVARRLKDKEV